MITPDTRRKGFKPRKNPYTSKLNRPADQRRMRLLLWYTPQVLVPTENLYPMVTSVYWTSWITWAVTHLNEDYLDGIRALGWEVCNLIQWMKVSGLTTPTRDIVVCDDPTHQHSVLDNDIASFLDNANEGDYDGAIAALDSAAMDTTALDILPEDKREYYKEHTQRATVALVMQDIFRAVAVVAREDDDKRYIRAQVERLIEGKEPQ